LPDASAAGNVVSSGTSAAIEQDKLIFGYEQTWRYDDSGGNLGTTWRQADYDDAAWPLGPGLLGFEDPPLLPVPLRTTLRPPEFTGITYYFRTRFHVGEELSGLTLRLRHTIDDGAVFYLNGEEIHRARVPEGQNSTTVATQNVETQVEGPFTLNRPAVAGVNVLAAEVHQSSRNSADVVFGAELVASSLQLPDAAPGPRLQLYRTSDEISLHWDAPDFVLTEADSPSGPWRLVARPTLPYRVSFSGGPVKFYRLMAPTP